VPEARRLTNRLQPTHQPSLCMTDCGDAPFLMVHVKAEASGDSRKVVDSVVSCRSEILRIQMQTLAEQNTIIQSRRTMSSHEKLYFVM
jgi:hypothetical protein